MPKHLRNGVGQLFVLASLERRQSLAGYRVFFVKVTQIPYKTLEKNVLPFRVPNMF